MTPFTLLVHDDEFNVLHELPITFFQNRNKKTGLAVLVGASDGDSVGPPLAVERLHEVRDRTLAVSMARQWCNRHRSDYQPLFFDVMALKADQHCSTSLLLQCGQRISPSSWSTRNRILEKSFLQLWQKNS